MRNDRSSAAHWDVRYDGDDYLFGTLPDPFLVEVVEALPRGRALSLGDGEGRHGVWLAEQGYDVTTLDLSPVGVAKANRLAAERGVSIDARVGSFAELDWSEDGWDLVTLLYVHPPVPVRTVLHAGVRRALRAGGSYVVVGHSPEQVARGGRGPREEGQALTLAALRAELEGLEVVRSFEGERAADGDERRSRHLTALHARRPVSG